VVFHYEEALYQVYAPLPFTFVITLQKCNALRYKLLEIVIALQ